MSTPVPQEEPQPLTKQDINAMDADAYRAYCGALKYDPRLLQLADHWCYLCPLCDIPVQAGVYGMSWHYTTVHTDHPVKLDASGLVPYDEAFPVVPHLSAVPAPPRIPALTIAPAPRAIEPGAKARPRRNPRRRPRTPGAAWQDTLFDLPEEPA